MILYVFRHGEAGPARSSDADRSLTAFGRNQILAKGRAKEAELSSAEVVLHSPLIRAWESADLLKNELQINQSKCVDWLQPSSNPVAAIDSLFLLQSQNCWQSAILVSHLPFVSSFIELLCGLPAGRIAMSTGSVVALETEVIARGCTRLIWQLY